MMVFKNTYNINKIKDNKFLAYTHLGLGDHIVCNGLLNHFSESFSEIYLPVKSRDLNNLNYLYKDNDRIKVFKIEHETEVKDINNFAEINNLTILKVGFKKRKPPFNISFYEQFDLPYNYSFNKFKIIRRLSSLRFSSLKLEAKVPFLKYVTEYELIILILNKSKYQTKLFTRFIKYNFIMMSLAIQRIKNKFVVCNLLFSRK